MEQTPVRATVAEGLLEEANVSAWIQQNCNINQLSPNTFHIDFSLESASLKKREVTWLFYSLHRSQFVHKL